MEKELEKTILRRLLTLTESNGPPATQPGERPVLITTEYRCVFFGYATDTSGETITLTRARNCIYWAKSIGGFLGLASNGPNSDCKIGAVVTSLEARKVTTVTEVTATATKAWENAPCVK